MNLAQLQHASPREIADHLTRARDVSRDELAAALIGLALYVQGIDRAVGAAAVLLTEGHIRARQQALAAAVTSAFPKAGVA